MIAALQQPCGTAPSRLATSNQDETEAMIRFSIAPTDAGAWLWRTFGRDGQLRAHGLASTRKQAAALVIRDIVLARSEPALLVLAERSAEAA